MQARHRIALPSHGPPTYESVEQSYLAHSFSPEVAQKVRTRLSNQFLPLSPYLLLKKKKKKKLMKQ